MFVNDVALPDVEPATPEYIKSAILCDASAVDGHVTTNDTFEPNETVAEAKSLLLVKSYRRTVNFVAVPAVTVADSA